MRLKGLVWFFAIILILISVFQLSFTWVVNSHESAMKAKAEKQVRISNPNARGDEKDDHVNLEYLKICDTLTLEEIHSEKKQKARTNGLIMGNTNRSG